MQENTEKLFLCLLQLTKSANSVRKLKEELEEN